MTCFDKAREDYKRSIEAVEETRGQIIQEAHRISFFGVDKMRVYRDLILLLVRREQIRDLQAGLEFAERSKTRSFLDSLALTPLSAPVSLPLGLVQKERALIEEYRTLLDALQRAVKLESLRRIRSRFLQVKDELQAIWSNLTVVAPEFVALRRASPLTFEEVKSCLQNV